MDPATGIVPWYITVTTAENPSFTVTYQQLPGVPASKAWWKNLGDGRVFGDRAELWEYPAEHDPLLELRQHDAQMHVIVTNKEDGTGRLRPLRSPTSIAGVPERVRHLVGCHYNDVTGRPPWQTHA